MGFRRGLMLGVIVGLVGAVVSGEPSAAEGDPSGGGGSRVDEARTAAKWEREATEARLDARFRFAKETGRTPETDT